MEKSQNFIVIDNDSVNNLICEFSIKGYHDSAVISIFTDPEKALEMIQKEYSFPAGLQPTVLFLDINMPFMSGWEFLDVFENFNSYIKQQFTIYILSSSVNEIDMKKAEDNLLVSGFISKPLTTFNINNLLSHQYKHFEKKEP